MGLPERQGAGIIPTGWPMMAASDPQDEIMEDANATLLTTEEVAKILRTSVRNLRRFTAPRGPLACVRVGKRGVRFRRSDLDAYIEQSANVS